MYLAEAHPVAADLDLIVDAAQELQVPVRAPAGEITRLVTSAARHALILGERNRRQVGAAAITAGQTHTGDVQFTPHSHRAAVSAVVENQQCVLSIGFPIGTTSTGPAEGQSK